MMDKIFVVGVLILYFFTGCGTKQVQPDSSIKDEIIKNETAKKKRRNIDVDKIEKRYGNEAKIRAIRLDQLINSLLNVSESRKIKNINSFFNLFKFTTDYKLWNIKDYWATRMEFIGRGAGDCEDFVIAKYFTLAQLGVSTKKLYFTYVKSLSLSQAHMVLTYYKTPNSIPLVLDNIKKQILPATMRDDLVPVYSFNGEALYIAKKTGLGQIVPLGNERNEKWQNLIYRIKRKEM